MITDEDGDNATLVWKRKGIERCEGDAEFLGGTGKYTGLKGSNTVYGALRSAADPGIPDSVLSGPSQRR